MTSIEGEIGWETMMMWPSPQLTIPLSQYDIYVPKKVTVGLM
jgi:hypothetical protein